MKAVFQANCYQESHLHPHPRPGPYKTTFSGGTPLTQASHIIAEYSVFTVLGVDKQSRQAMRLHEQHGYRHLVNEKGS